MGADRVAVSIFPPHFTEHLVGGVFRQIAKIDQRQRPRCRGHKKMGSGANGKRTAYLA